MKIIFLDLDGVLNTNTQWSAGTKDRSARDSYGDPFCKLAVAELGRIITATDAKIVISSTWRMSGLPVMRELWQHRNLPGNILDITGVHSSWIRGYEVKEWLMDKGFSSYCMGTAQWDKDQRNPDKVHNYCIIDDDADFFLYQGPHFVHCNAQNGLTTALADKAIRILNSPVPSPDAAIY